MTAIVGFNCLDGILMMSDTEETTSDFTKSTCDKLYRFSFDLGTVITGGAGDAHMIDCANQELQQSFARELEKPSNQPLDAEMVRTGLNRFARRFYAETTAEAPGSSFEMLIAVNISKKQSFLFRWKANRVLWIPTHSHDVIGSGVIQVHPMLQDFQFTSTTDVALFCGMRMMYFAKRSIAGVGGNTVAVALFNDGASLFYGTNNTDKIERLVAGFDQYLTKFVFTSVSHMAREYPEETERNIADSFASVPDTLKQYRDSYREILDNPDRF